MGLPNRFEENTTDETPHIVKAGQILTIPYLVTLLAATIYFTWEQAQHEFSIQTTVETPTFDKYNEMLGEGIEPSCTCKNAVTSYSKFVNYGFTLDGACNLNLTLMDEVMEITPLSAFIPPVLPTVLDGMSNMCGAAFKMAQASVNGLYASFIVSSNLLTNTTVEGQTRSLVIANQEMIRSSFEVSQAAVSTWALVNKPATTNPIRDWVQTGCKQKKLNVVPVCSTDCGDGNTGYCCYDTVFEKNEPCPCQPKFTTENPVNNIADPFTNSQVGNASNSARGFVVDPTYDYCPPEEPVGEPVTQACNCQEDFSCSRESVEHDTPTYVPPRFMGKIGTGEGGGPKAKKMSLGCDAYKSVTDWDIKPIMADLAFIIRMNAAESEVGSSFNTETDKYGTPYRNKRAEVFKAANHLNDTFVQSKFDTLAAAINSGFIDKATGWQLNVNFQKYYEDGCAPTQCTYFETRRRSVVEIITTVFALVGGIDALAGVLFGKILFNLVTKATAPKSSKVAPEENAEKAASPTPQTEEPSTTAAAAPATLDTAAAAGGTDAAAT